MKCRFNIAFAVLLSALFGPNLFGQATNPPYIAEMPSVDKVMKAMQTSDSDETAARQMAAFTQLKTMIEDMSGPRQYQRGGLTPDETKVRQAYYTAYYNISQLKPQYKPFTAMRGLDISPTFRTQLIQQLFPPGFAAEYAKVMGQAKQQSAAVHQRAVQIGEAKAKADQEAAQKLANEMQKNMPANSTNQEVSQDPETRAMRRCVAAGRLPAVCMGNGIMGSLMGNTNGLLSSMVPDVVGKEVTGPQMAGAFAGNGGWRLEFDEASVTLTCLGINATSHAYTIAILNNRPIITITTSPKDVVLSLNGDTLTGPGPVVVDGTVSAGVRDGVDYSGKPATIYQYREVTRTCPAPNLSSKGAGAGIVGAEKNMLEGMFSNGKTGPPTPPGLRMNGTYAAGSGFSVEFHPESAILGCGPEAARAYPYQVIADGRQTAVKVNAPNHPLTLAITANNTLDPGPGQYLVEGRRITGKDANDDFTFAPLNATCALATLSPGPVPSGGGQTAGVVPASASLPAAAPGNAVLAVRAALADPAAGTTVLLLNDSIETLVKNSGFQPAASTSLLKSFANCPRNNANCQKGTVAVYQHVVAAVKAGPNAPVSFSGVKPGTYYVMAGLVNNGKNYLWNTRVDLKAGANSVTLDAKDAAPLDH